jgi:Uma2 family endonuclease
MAPGRGKKPATYDDILALPDNVVGQILGGELFVSPRPASPHGFAASGLHMVLAPMSLRGGRGGRPGGWSIVFEPELHLHGDVLVPDLAGWRYETMPQRPSVKVFELRPDWVCEVQSPSTAAIDRHRKMPIYQREGVGHVWLIDPADRTVEVHSLVGQSYQWVVIPVDQQKVRAAPFEEIEIDLTELWTDEPQAT